MLTKAIGAYQPLMIAALACACFLLLMFMAFGEPEHLSVLLVLLHFAPFLLLVAAIKAPSAKPIFSLFGAVGAALGASICAIIQVTILRNKDPLPDSVRLEMAVFSVIFSVVFLMTPFVVFVLTSLASVKRFKQLNSPEVTPCPQ